MTRFQNISKSEARRIVLNAQGLLKSRPFGSGPQSVSKAIDHLGYVQIDTISVVERAHHHTLWSRIPAYQPEWLHSAQVRDRKVFEYWSHAAAYLPMKDYRFSLPVMKVFKDQQDRWPKSSKTDMRKVITRIREEGPLKSRDFESNYKGGTWWDWKPDKWALQRLFLEGKLMVSHREGFQRVYDLPEKILPETIDLTTPTLMEYYGYMITQTLTAQGIATKKELKHLRTVSSVVFDKLLQELVDQESIIPIQVEDDKKYFTLPAFLNKRIRIPEKINILSPFDNTVIWRNRLSSIFDFDYTLECYVPLQKRVYGYFCLPILYNDQFVGRIDMKANRKQQTLDMISMHWLPNHGGLQHHPLFEEALHSFATFNQCDTISFRKSHTKFRPDR